MVTRCLRGRMVSSVARGRFRCGRQVRCRRRGDARRRSCSARSRARKLSEYAHGCGDGGQLAHGPVADEADVSSSAMVRGSSPGSCGVGKQFGGDVLGVTGSVLASRRSSRLADVTVGIRGHDLSDFFAVAAQGQRRGSSRSTRWARACRPSHEGVLHAHCVGWPEALRGVLLLRRGSSSCVKVFTASRMTGANFSRRSG